MSAQSIPAQYTQLEGPGSIRPGRRLQWWSMMTTDVRKRNGDPPWKYNREQWLQFVPLGDLPKLQFEHHHEAMMHWLREPHHDPWALEKGIPNVTVPNFDVTGWHDHCNGDLLLHRTMIQEANTEVARTRSHTVIGPWSHAGRGGSRVGKIDFTPRARYNITAATLRWFDHWLKDEPNEVARLAPFRIFVMGENRWRNEQEWPPARAENQTLFLTSGGRANTPAGDGRLIDTNPAQAGRDTYAYDPADPVPTLYGKGAFTVRSTRHPWRSGRISSSTKVHRSRNGSK